MPTGKHVGKQADLESAFMVERWAPGLADPVALAKARAQRTADAESRSLWKGPEAARLGAGWIDAELPEQPFIVDGLLPVDAVGFVGAGGTGKSSVLLWMLTNIVLGQPLLRADVRRSGAALYVSAEDDEPMVRLRLRKIADAASLSQREKERLAGGFFVEDVSGLPVRLVEDYMGAVHTTNAVDGLIERYRDSCIAVVVLDPLSLLGPGERSGNDGMAEMMRASRRISRALNCAVIVVHHESKVGARDKHADQYAGRGGAAFADNSRGNMQLVAVTGMEIEHRGRRYRVPEPITQDDIDDENVLALLLHKLTAAKRDPRPIIIRRVGWRFEAFTSVALDGREALEEQRSQRERDILQVLVDGLTSEPKATHSAHSLAETCAVRKLVARDAAKATIADLRAQLIIVEMPIPMGHIERRGAKKTYLVPAARTDLSL